MNGLIVLASALALWISMPSAMAETLGEAAADVLVVPEDVGQPAEALPAETEMPTADTIAGEDKAADRLPQDNTINQVGDSIDSGFEGG